jgi:hypothetical protein
MYGVTPCALFYFMSGIANDCTLYPERTSASTTACSVKH